MLSQLVLPDQLIQLVLPAPVIRLAPLLQLGLLALPALFPLWLP